MGDKVKIYLSDFRYMNLPGKDFVVEKLVNTTRYTIGQALTVEHVQDLCNMNSIEITILPRENK